MTDERAALLITAYAEGLRRELALLGASEITDSVSEIVAMLRDASEGDADIAAAEIENLGPPEVLARTILEQHGLHTGPGTPAPSWWRLGVAAPIDILVGLALPIAAACFTLAFTVVGTPDTEGEAVFRLIAAACSMAGIALTGAMAWNYLKPWREGGTRSTVGMTLTGISVVRVGASRTVALTSDLKSAGLAHGGRGRTGSVVTLVLALSILAFAGSYVVSSADSGRPNVERLVGTTEAQQAQVTDTLSSFYESLIGPVEGDPGAPARYLNPNGLGVESVASALERMQTPKLHSYAIGAMTSPEPGVWIVTVDEQRDKPRTVLVTMGLSMDWGVGYIGTTWTVLDYQPK
jgi:hypothetical protein